MSALKFSTLDGLKNNMLRSVQAHFERKGFTNPASLNNLQRMTSDSIKYFKSKGKEKYIESFLKNINSTTLEIKGFSMDLEDDGSVHTIDKSNAKSTLYNINGKNYSFSDMTIDPDLLENTIFEGHYAGVGSRFKSPIPKGLFTKDSMLGSGDSFLEEILSGKEKHEPFVKEIMRLNGVTDKTIIWNKDQIKSGWEAVKARFKPLSGDLNILDMVFIRKSFEVYDYFKKEHLTNDDIKNIMSKIKFKIIVNREFKGDEFVNHFVERNFYGFNRDNFIFHKPDEYDSFMINEDGKIVEDTSKSKTYKSTHLGNHGLVPLRTPMDYQWYKVDNKGLQTSSLSSDEYLGFLGNSKLKMIESMEDVTQFNNGMDFRRMWFVNEFGYKKGVEMFMEFSKQKDINPQKGGFGGLLQDPSAWDEWKYWGIKESKNAVFETNVTPDVDPENINFLNRNRNIIVNPRETAIKIVNSNMINNLHPTFYIAGYEEDKTTPILRLNWQAPQGDQNFYLTTNFIKYLPEQMIQNLKDSGDLLKALEAMEKFNNDREAIDFAKEFLGFKWL